MKKHKITLKKRIIATALSLVMVFGMIPATIFATTTPTTTANSASILNLDKTTPDGYESNGANPYGTAQGEEFMSVTENEYLLFQSTRPTDSDGFSRVTVFDGLSTGDVTQDDDDNNLLNSSSLYSIYDRLKETDVGNVNSTRNMSYVSAVGFRPFGGARDNWVAYVGAQCTEDSSNNRHANVYIWVQNLDDMTVSSLQYVCSADYLDDDNGIAQYKFKNFFQITAGDY